MDPARRKLLNEYLLRKYRVKTILGQLFGRQRNLVLSPSKRKVAVLSRRAGKTWAIIRYLLLEAIRNPESTCLYVTETKQDAKKLVWGPLKSLAADTGINAYQNSTELTMMLPNGAQIWLAGVKDETTMRRLRGHPYKLVCIDEAQNIPGEIFEPLIKDVILPGVRDYDGTIIATGTPNPSCEGYLYDISTADDSTWDVHRWTVVDNPMFPVWRGQPNWQEIARQRLAEWMFADGYKEDDPGWQREYLGIWARSLDEYIYRFDDTCLGVSATDWTTTKNVLGIDLGFNDDAAWVPVSYDGHGVTQLEPSAAAGLSLTEIMDRTSNMIATYDPERIVVDPSSGGTHLIEEIRQRFEISVHAADKQAKASSMRLLDNSLRNGQTTITSRELYGQMRKLRWNKQFTREREGQPCDLHDAFLYSWKEARHWTIDTSVDNRSEHQRMFDAEMEAIARQEENMEYDDYQGEMM